MKTISVLGSTGSIGTQTLDVVRHHSDIRVAALTAGRNVRLLEEQIREFRPLVAVLSDEAAARDLEARVRDLDVRILSGMDGLIEAASCPDRCHPRREGHRPGKQGNACDGRASDYASGKGIRRKDSAGGF